jgi:hypothetical protein
MRQGSNSKRPRGKGGNRGSNGGPRNPLTRSYDSNGPAGRVRGNPHQVHEKYLSLARDAQADDPVLAENLLQHADHYYRLILEANNGRFRHENSRRDDYHDDYGDGMDDDSRGNQQTDGRHGDEDERDRSHERRDEGDRDYAETDRFQNASESHGHGNGAGNGNGAEREAEAPEAQPRRQRRPRKPKAEASESDAVTTDAA